MEVRDFIISDLLVEQNEDRFMDCLFNNDDGVNINEIIQFVQRRKNEYKINISEEFEKECDEYIKELNEKSDERDIFISLLKGEMLRTIPIDSVISFDQTTFWNMFSIAIKKCLNNPRITFEEQAYIGIVKGIFDDLTKDQLKAHNMCITGFNFDADLFKKQDYALLATLLHSMRSFKRDKDKKKHIKRVLRKTKKVMQIYKINHRNVPDYVFNGKRYLVPTQFTKVIVKQYLN